jgi:hydrogenase-4 transcriptional activator
MEEFREILLSVWQEACRHIEISQSTKNLTATLVRYLPIEQVLVQRIDPARSCLEAVAVGLAGPRSRMADSRADCAKATIEALLAWCRQGEVAHRRGGSTPQPDWSVIVPKTFSGDALAGPLGDPASHCGLLVFLAPAGRGFARQHIDLAQLLLEPFSVALENDLRIRDMAALREAAEADKRSLLTRLGRKALGDTIVGSESGLRPVLDRVELVAPSDAPVLIFGETGTGKELVARAIHNRSPRRNGPFDRVNCGAIPPELIDSQLFGHERGAFTGAVESRRGWFERADGGTLFLDEIGELPLAAQVRMLRILQDGWMERVGGEQPINVDVRIIAATHCDLASMVAEGRFRQDLWYRIAVFPIVLPPLRERREDITPLAEHLAQRAATRFGLAPASPTAEDLTLLMSYPWPGNVRELGAVIDRAAILGNGKRLEVAKALGVDAEVPMTTRPVSHASSEHPPTAAVEPLDVAVRRHIESALVVTQGRIEGRHGTAAMLRINPHTLRARMRKLGIDWARFRNESR